MKFFFNKTKNKFKKIFLLLPIWWFWLFLLSGLFGAFVSIFFKLEETFTLHIAFLIPFFFWKGIFVRFISKRWYKPFRFRWLLEFFLYILSLQIVLFLFSPATSLIPEKIQARIGLIQPIEALDAYICPIEDALLEVKDFWRDVIDFDEVEVVYGGISVFFKEKVIASVFGDTVKLNPILSCTSKSKLSHDYVLAHELTHIWQNQNNIPPPGLGLFFRTVDKLVKRVFDTDALNKKYYYYGGESGLKEAIDSRKTFLDFETEQQAEIMASYYMVKQGKSYYDRRKREFTEEYISYLEHFASQVLEGRLNK